MNKSHRTLRDSSSEDEELRSQLNQVQSTIDQYESELSSLDKSSLQKTISEENYSNALDPNKLTEE